MGAWGSAPFDNDDAADWSYRLVDGGGPSVVAEALHAVRGADPPDLPQAASAVGAAAVVAAGLGVSGVELPDEVREWLANASPSAWPPLAPDAVAALDRVLAYSELSELWGEAGDDSWAAETRALRDAISELTR